MGGKRPVSGFEWLKSDLHDFVVFSLHLKRERMFFVLILGFFVDVTFADDDEHTYVVSGQWK